MKRKLLSLLMALTMALSLVPVSALAASYGDTAGHWAQAAIDRWSGYGIVTGDASGFRPNDNMTRAEAATVFSRLFSLTDATAKTTFTDVNAGDWYYDAVNKCVNAGIMNGVGDGMMSPNSPLTREMFFVMFARGLGIKEQSATKGLKADGAAWSAGYINALTDKGYVKGMDGKVNATANINRASVMALLDQTITTYANEAGATVTGTGKGVTLIAAEGVTVTGNVDTLVVAGSSEAETVAFAGDENTAYASAVYAAPRFSVIIRNAVIALLNIIAPAKVELEGTTSVSSVAVTQTAAETTVDVGASASVAAVETAAAETKVEGAGKVEAVAATGEAADTVAVTTPNTEVATSKSVENADGSTTTTVTESKNDAAGKSTGETKTETTVKETTAADGTKTTEKTATATVTNAAGKVTETTKTESTVTEKTASDGTKTTETAATVTKADGTGKVVETTKTESTVKETTAADGTKTTETAATVAKTDAAGKTETTKTDATVTEKTAANGTKTTETAATVAKTDASGKTETTTTTATATETTNANGSVTTATTATVEKTAADGTKTTDKVESTATATTNADGSTTTAKTETVATTDASGKTTTTKTESTATATVNANGTTTTATEAKVEKTDESGKTTTETVKSTETAKENADGSTTATTTTSTTDASGKTTTTTETKTSTEAESSVSGSTGAAASSTDTSSSTPAQTSGGGSSGSGGGSSSSDDSSSSSDSNSYYTVTFEANGGTGSMSAQSIINSGSLKANTFTREGYTFDGWNTAANGSGTKYADGATVSANLTLYAQWKPTPATLAKNAKTAFASGYNSGTGEVDWATLIKASYYLQIGQGKKLNEHGTWVDDASVTTGKLTDAEVTELTDYYTSIKKLNMSNKVIAQNGFYSGTDAGALTIFTGLTELNLSNTGVTDIGGIADLKSLTKLNISGLTSVTNGGALVNLTKLTELDISNTGITDLNVMWKGENEGGVTAAAAPRFASLTKLTAKNLALTSIAGLVEVVNSVQNNSYEDSGKTWDLSGSTLAADNGIGHVCRIMNIFDAGTFNPPAMVAAANMNTNATELATLATKAKETTITVPAGKKLTVGSNVYIGGSNDEASLVLTGGSVKTTLGGGQGSAPVIKFDLLDNAVAEVPSGKFFTTAFSLNDKTVAYTSMTIAGDAKLTVNGATGNGGYGFRVASGSGTTGTTLTNNGTIEIGSDGVMDVMSKATFNNNGTLIVNGKLDVVDGANVTASENTVKAVLTAANGYNYDPVYTRTGTIAVNELTVNYSAPQSAFTAQDSKAVDDLARFLGAMHRNTTANAATIKYGDKTYTWDNNGTLIGSNWKNGSTTLVSAIATALGSGLQGGTSTNFTITVDGVNVTVNVTITDGGQST